MNTYTLISEKINAIEQLGIYHTRWNNINHDLCPNRQKLYCQLPDGTKCVLSAEYTETSALIEVYPEAPINDIGTVPAPKLAPKVLKAIQSEYPSAQIVGDRQFVRVCF